MSGKNVSPRGRARLGSPSKLSQHQSPLLCGISFSSRGFVSEQALVKQAFVCGQLLGTHTPLLVGDNEEAVSGAAAVGLKGNTDGKRTQGGNSWVEINWEDLKKSGCCS